VSFFIAKGIYKSAYHKNTKKKSKRDAQSAGKERKGREKAQVTFYATKRAGGSMRGHIHGRGRERRERKKRGKKSLFRLKDVNEGGKGDGQLPQFRHAGLPSGEGIRRQKSGVNH